MKTVTALTGRPATPDEFAVMVADLLPGAQAFRPGWLWASRAPPRRSGIIFRGAGRRHACIMHVLTEIPYRA